MISLKFDDGELRALNMRRLEKGFAKAAKRASATSARDMRAATVKQVRKKLAIKVKPLKKAIHVRKNRARVLDDMEWGVDIAGDAMRVSNFRHRQNKKGVKATIRKGKSVLFKSAFVARMKSGRTGVFVRRGAARLPLWEPLATRPVDVLRDEAGKAAIATKGRRSFTRTLERLLDAE